MLVQRRRIERTLPLSPITITLDLEATHRHCSRVDSEQTKGSRTLRNTQFTFWDSLPQDAATSTTNGFEMGWVNFVEVRLSMPLTHTGFMEPPCAMIVRLSEYKLLGLATLGDGCCLQARLVRLPGRSTLWPLG